MLRCFVIQPFDGGKFDKRFDDIFAPALKEVGFEPYRVDIDPSVDVPIHSIEQGIRDSALCLADISTDNQNVWYELGFAFAANRDVVLLCSSERNTQGFPFDIRHRNIITYKTESARDYSELSKKITERAGILRNRDVSLKQLSEHEQIAPQHGLSHAELVLLSILAGETAVPDSAYSTLRLQVDVEKSGLTTFAYGLAFRRFLRKSYIDVGQERDFDGSLFDAAFLTDAGWQWVDSNESLFVISHGPKNQQPDDDIPF